MGIENKAGASGTGDAAAAAAVEIVASHTLEAARRLADVWQGHSFRVSVWAQVPAGWAAYPGDEVAALTRALAQVLAPLEGRLLNDTLPLPSDEHLARWVREALQAAQPALRLTRVAVRSTAQQGVDLDAEGRVQLWRRYRLQAAHQLPNVPAGHKCGRLHGHAFEVVLHAAHGVAAPLRYEDLDEHWAPLRLVLNYRCLNDIDGLHNPTSEVLSAWLWSRLKGTLPTLAGVTVFETGSCGAHFDGTDYRIWKDFSFDSAVQLRHAPADALPARVHGHTYTLRLHLSAPLDTVMGWTVDYGEVKTLFAPTFQALDHHPLHLLPAGQGPADGDAASIGRWVLQQAKAGLPPLWRVDLYEQDGSGALVQHAPALQVTALPI
jgi:6-pyruvoyltetrahydropterin/6-carboxytetrahydropterin synthase